MNLSTCKEALRFVLEAEMSYDIPELPRPVLVGDSGIGKTSIVRQTFEEMVAEGIFDASRAVIVEKHLCQMELGDLIGMPDTTEDSTIWKAPCWWPKADKEGIAFFDEFGDTKNDVQRAVQQLLLEGELYEHKLPNRMPIVLAMNPVDPEFGSFSFSRQLKNRLMFWRIEPDVDEWVKFAHREKLLPGIDRVVLSMEGGLLEKVDFEVDSGFRNPRSITAAARLAALMTPEQSRKFGFAILSSICGKVMAASLQSIIESNLDETLLPISAVEILQGDMAVVHDRILKWKELGRLELVHETVNLLKGALTIVDGKIPLLPSDTLMRFVELGKCLPKDLLADFLKFMNENGHKSMAMKLSMNMDINRILKETFKKS